MIHSIQYLRFLGAILVLCYHIYALNYRYYPDINLPYIFSIGNFGVDIFFVISGYIMALISTNSQPGFKTTCRFLLKRARRIYPIYWLYTLIVLAIYAVYPNLVNSSYAETPSLFRSFFLLPSDTNPWLNVGWTLIYEVYFYLLIALLMFFKVEIRNIVLSSYFIFILSYSYIFYFDNNPENPLEKYYLSPLICEFILGYWLYHKSTLLSLRSGVVIILLALIVLLGATYLFDINSNLKRFIIYGFPALLITFGFLSVFHERKNFVFISKLGDISYSTYLSHVLVLNFVGVTFSFLGLNSPYASLICIIFSFIAVYFWSYISYQYIEKRISF